MSSRPLHPEARKAVSGATIIGVGQAAAVLIGVGTAILVPRVLGRTDYGWWILLRSIVQLMASASSIGMGDTMVCHYVPRLAGGDTRGAGLVFKTMVSARFLSAVLAAAVGAGMLLHTDSFPERGTSAAWLALSVLLQSVGLSCIQLLYGNRLLARVAVVYILQAAIIPTSVALAYATGGFARVPAVAALCDGMVAVLTFLLARKVFQWPSGWLVPAERRKVLSFGATVGLSSFLTGAAGNAIPWLMAKTGYTAAAIGFVGLGLRLSLLLKGTLMSVSGAVFPTLAVVSVTDGMERAGRWLSIASRGGALVVLALLGACLAGGPTWMGRVFGAEFADAAPVVTVCFAMLMPLWLGMQATRLLLLAGRAPQMLMVILVLLAGSLAPLLFIPADPVGMTPAWVSLVACGVFAVSVLAVVPFRRRMLRTWLRIVPAALWVLVAWAIGRWVHTPWWAAAAGVAWAGGLVAVAMASRVMDWYEIRDLWASVRRTRPSAVENDDESVVA